MNEQEAYALIADLTIEEKLLLYKILLALNDMPDIPLEETESPLLNDLQ